MASLNALPNEILEKVITNIPGRPFKTEYLLISKALCYLFMTEQIRNLELYGQQVHSWIAIITNDDIKSSPLELRYCNLLNKIIKINVIFHEDLSEEPIAKFISSCPNLRVLILQRSYSSPVLRWNAGPVISNLPSSITEISFTRFSVANEEKGIHPLVSYAKRNTRLEALCFDDIDIDGVPIWDEFLKPNLVIKQLCLRDCGLDNKAAHALAESLKENTTLTDLNLERNSIGDKGAHAFAAALRQNTTLVNLNLGMNSIGVEGARALAESLKQNTALTSLNLWNNSIGAEGACALAEGLKRNTTLAKLNLWNNGVGVEGARALAEGLERNKALTNLNLQWNNIAADGASALAKGLVQNTVLTNLDLRGNNINSTLIDPLKQNTNLTVEC